MPPLVQTLLSILVWIAVLYLGFKILKNVVTIVILGIILLAVLWYFGFLL